MGVYRRTAKWLEDIVEGRYALNEAGFMQVELRWPDFQAEWEMFSPELQAVPSLIPKLEKRMIYNVPAYRYISSRV